MFRSAAGASRHHTYLACRWLTGVAMGIGAMRVVMPALPWPRSSSLLLLASDGLALRPLVIVAVVVARLGGD